MDPNETLRLILASTTKAEAKLHCKNLAYWLSYGGFPPCVPPGTKYWPGTGTGYAILDPGPDNGYQWEFVQYDDHGFTMNRWSLVCS